MLHKLIMSKNREKRLEILWEKYRFFYMVKCCNLLILRIYYRKSMGNYVEGFPGHQKTVEEGISHLTFPRAWHKSALLK